MSAKVLLALGLVAALVAFASPFYLDDDVEEEEGGVAEDELEAAALPFYLQKRGRGSRFSRCVDPETGKRCPCDRTKSRGLVNRCKK